MYIYIIALQNKYIYINMTTEKKDILAINSNNLDNEENSARRGNYF